MRPNPEGDSTADSFRNRHLQQKATVNVEEPAGKESPQACQCDPIQSAQRRQVCYVTEEGHRKATCFALENQIVYSTEAGSSHSQ